MFVVEYATVHVLTLASGFHVSLIIVKSSFEQLSQINSSSAFLGHVVLSQRQRSNQYITVHFNFCYNLLFSFP